MPGGTRVQQLAYGLGLGKQSAINSAGSTFIRFRKSNLDIHSPDYQTEDDADEIGKGSEFPTQIFPTNWELGAPRIQKFGSAEFMTWALAYALGGVAEATGTYTLTPINPANTLELPYFSVVQQLAEGGGSAADDLFVGCAVQEVDIQFEYGPGRKSVTLNVTLAGSGNYTTPSGVTLPAVENEHYMLSQSMSLSVNGVDLVAAFKILRGRITWNNNFLLPLGFQPGSGIVQGAAVRNNIRIGKRTFAFQMENMFEHDSPELAALIAQSTGVTTLGFSYDSTHNVSFNIPRTSYKQVTRGNIEGLATVQANLLPQDDGTDALVTVTAKCGISGIAQ